MKPDPGFQMRAPGDRLHSWFLAIGFTKIVDRCEFLCHGYSEIHVQSQSLYNNLILLNFLLINY